MDGVPVSVSEHLKLDVPRMIDILFDQHAIITEGRLCFALAAFEGGIKVGMPIDTPHAFATAAGRRLDQNRIAKLIGLLFEELWILALSVIAGDHRDAGFLHERFGAILQTHSADSRRRRTNKSD